MPDPTNLETLQARIARQGYQEAKAQVLRQLLGVFQPGSLQGAALWDYLTLLDRVRTVLDDELASATAPDPLPPTPPEPPQGDVPDA